jgi:uncharacterized membrane protein YfcA
MTLSDIIILIFTGAGAGFAGGLLGIGGSFLMTPVQYMVFTGMGIPADAAIKLAFGTNLLVVLPTAASGAWRHNKNGSVLWGVATIIGTLGMFAAFGGATLAAIIPGTALKIAFGAVILLSSIRMLVARPQLPEQEPKDNVWLLIGWAIPIGIVTGIIGIGGGTVIVPVMILVLEFKIHQAVATSLAIMMFTSIGGVAGYIINGWVVPGLPPYSVDYVNLSSWFLLAVSSIGMAQVGAIIAHRMPPVMLRYIFIVIMFYLGLKMIGLFEWLGWPI